MSDFTSWNASALEQLSDDMRSAHQELDQQLEELNSEVMQAFGGEENWTGPGREAYDIRKQAWETAQQDANALLTKFEQTAQSILERYGAGESNIESMWAG